MASNEIDDKKRLIQIAEAVRQKYDKFRYGETDYALQMERKYKPLIKLQKDDESLKRSDPPVDVIKIKSEDSIFGLRQREDGIFVLGEYPVTFDNGKIKVSDREYISSNGLLSLLTKKIPRDYTDQDLKLYKEMLIFTGAHLRKTDDQIKSCRGSKTKFIKKLFKDGKDGDEENEDAVGKRVNFLGSPKAQQFLNNLSVENDLIDKLLSSKPKRNLFPSNSNSSPTRPLPSSFSPEIIAGSSANVESKDSKYLESGRGMQMKVIKERDHVKNLHTYWDDPNELVDRLCLLHASKEAGNTNVINEITSIITELRQAGYIR